jgi:hypothetical protein
VAAALRRVAEQKRKRSRARKLGLSLSLAAALTGLGVGSWFSLGRDPLAARGGSDASVLVNGPEGEVSVTDEVGHVVNAVSALTEGYGVRTERGSATLGFPSGARAKVANKSSLKITRARASEALYLARGGVDVEVPKLDPTRGFSVETPDARVTVHGTHFSVLVEPTVDGPRTRVHVTHGLVSVQQAGHEVFLTAGQVWPSSGEAPAAPATPTASDRDSGTDQPALSGDDAKEAGEAPPPASIDDAKSGARASRSRPRKFDSRELADQNEHFARAMTLKKNSDPTGALRELGLLLRRYPGSPLTQELRVERLRLLRGLGRTASAEREARRYLREFPQGYAVPEAQELLSGQP